MKPLSFNSLFLLLTLLSTCILLEHTMFVYGKGQDRHPFLVCLSCPYSTASQSRYRYFHCLYVIIHYLCTLLKLLRRSGSESEVVHVDCTGDDGKGE